MEQPSTDPLTIHRLLVGTTTVWSGVSYIYAKDAVKILKARNRSQRSGRV